MQKGISVDAIPRQLQSDPSVINQSVLEGQINTDDELLKERVKSL